MQEDKKSPNGVEKPKKYRKKMSKNKKILIAVIAFVMAIFMAIAVILIVTNVKRSTPPSLESVRPRVEALVNASQEVNDLLWGKGLPTYPRVYRQSAKTFTIKWGEHEDNAYYYVIDDATHGEVIVYQYWLRYVPEGTQKYTYLDVEKGGVIIGDVQNMEDWRYATRSKTPVEGAEPIFFAEESGYYYYRLDTYTFVDGMYNDENDPEKGYDYVDMAAADFFAVEEIYRAAAAVYSTNYLAAISEGLFEGFTTPAGYVSGARYRDFDDPDDAESTTVLIQSNTYEPLVKTKRVYNFDTMTLHGDSTSTFLKIEVDSHLEGSADVLRVTLTLTMQDGLWFLDGPTY